MDIKKFKFIAPKDIKKGELFSFEELYDSDENIDSLMDVNKSFIESVAKNKSNEVEEKLLADYRKKEEELREYFEKKKLDLEVAANEKVDSAVKVAEANIKSQLEVANSKVDMLSEINEESKKTINTLKTVYDDMLEQKLNKLREENAKERESLIKEYEDKQKSSTTIGENAEEEVRSSLRTLFPEDIIEKPNHALGEADIMHTIVDKGKNISRVYYEIKNKKKWAMADYENFAAKVRKEDHDFNIYIAKTLPKQSKSQNLFEFNSNFFYDEVNNIYLTSFDNWLPVIAVIRKQAITLYQTKANQESMNDIKDKIYEFFKSPEFNNYLIRLKKNFDELEEVFKAIQKSTVDGKAVKERAALEIANLETEINSKLNV